MIYIKIKETLYPATVSGRMADKDWDNRASKSITLEMDYPTASNLFIDGLVWSIADINQVPSYAEDGSYAYDEDGNQIMEEKITEFDNSEYCIAGDITDHRDGTITVKMGKLTELEEAYEIMFGGVDSELEEDSEEFEEELEPSEPESEESESKLEEPSEPESESELEENSEIMSGGVD